MASTMPVLQRVDRLEELMAQLTYNVAQSSREARLNDQRSRRAEADLREHLADVSNELRTNINNLSIEMRYSEAKARKADEVLRKQLAENSRELRATLDQLSQEMAEFKDEMGVFKDEMGVFKDEIREENRQLSQHLAKVSDDMRRSRRNLNKKVAEISNKMGTLAEDLVAPSIPSILAKVVNCTTEPEMIGVRIRKRLPDGLSAEYDVMSVCGDYVLICEVKSRLRPEDVRNFRDETLSKARLFWPEYAGKKIIGALGTFYVEPSLIKHGERLGFIMLGVVDGLMNTLNQEGFVPTEF